MVDQSQKPLRLPWSLAEVASEVVSVGPTEAASVVDVEAGLGVADLVGASAVAETTSGAVDAVAGSGKWLFLLFCPPHQMRK